MKLLIIVLCLLSERYLVHTFSLYRKGVFLNYSHFILPHLARVSWMNNAWALLAALVLPPVIIVGILLCVFNSFFYGIIGFVLNFVIFYYCLGPDNIFYPDAELSEQVPKNQGVASYFSKANTQVFAAIFWYLVFGPAFLLLYRLINLSQKVELVGVAADLMTDILEWIPARLSALFYLLVGNFQHGFRFFVKKFFAKPIENQNLLGEVGILALKTGADEDDVTIPYAQQLAEHALIVYLVLVALFMMLSWK